MEDPQPNIVQNAVKNITDSVVQNATQHTFESVINLNYWDTIATAISNRLADELKEQSFMQTQLELTEAQKEALEKELSLIVSEVVKNYKAGIKTDDRTKDVYCIVRDNMRGIIETTLSKIGAEINRGAVINAVAVSADSKGKDTNKIELQYSKHTGDITIPTKGVFISTNCVEVMRESICVDDIEDSLSANERGE